MKQIFPFLFSLLLISTNIRATTNAKMSVYEAINRAGYQRMLTQRIAKCYIAIVYNMHPDKNQKHLTGSMKVFEKNLEDLSGFAPTLQIGQQFDQLEQLWAEYRDICSNAYTLENAEIILKYNTRILTACNEAVVLLENYATESQGQINDELIGEKIRLTTVINMTGRQRMFSQRMLLYALAIHYNLGSQDENRTRLKETIQEFNRNSKVLSLLAKDDEDALSQHRLINKHWKKLEHLLNQCSTLEIEPATRQAMLEEALTTSETVLFASDELVFIYERRKG